MCNGPKADLGNGPRRAALTNLSKHSKPPDRRRVWLIQVGQPVREEFGGEAQIPLVFACLLGEKSPDLSSSQTELSRNWLNYGHIVRPNGVFLIQMTRVWSWTREIGVFLGMDSVS